jgi:hypothetical protein
VTAWGIAPARGRRHYCGHCGSVLVFVEERRPASLVQAEANKLTLGVEAHFTLFPECRGASTFQGHDTLACRCRRPLRLPREEGLCCARCDGFIAPDLAGSTSGRRRGAR